MNNQTINELNKRDFDPCFFSFSFASTSIFFDFGNDYIAKRDVISIIGCNIYGARRYITSIFADEVPKASDWYNLFMLIKKRGVKHVFYATILDDHHLKDALALAFPGISTFVSCYAVIKKIDRYFGTRYRDSFFKDFTSLYNASSLDEFNGRKKFFLEEYSAYPFVLDIINDDIDHIPLYFSLPSLIKKHVSAFYFLREITKKLTVNSHTKPYFSSIDDFIGLFLPTIISFELRRYAPKKEWNEVLNWLYQNHKDLLLEYL